MKTIKHTPTPYAIGIDTYHSDKAQIINKDGQHIAYVEISPEVGTAEFIVRACNSYEELLEVYKALLDGVEGYECENGYITRYWKNDAIKNAQKAISKAEGK